MASYNEYKEIYDAILDSLYKSPLTRGELISASLASLDLTEDDYADNSANGRKNVLKSRLGVLINDLDKKGVIELKDGKYVRNYDTPIFIRIERCEEAILDLLRQGPKTKRALKEKLAEIFRIKETDTQRDDARLFTFMGQILKRLVSERVIIFSGETYSLAPEMSAKIGNRQEILALRGDFLALLHSKGGEFFEHYFVNLLSKYLVRCGKTITESTVTGGASDGGIDGIVKTVDSLGFRETIMVQTKNRIDFITETEVRGFYGAVCAMQGSRGIFVTSSDFYPSAVGFLDSIDNCVGVNGEKIFTMAIDTSYGIKRDGGLLKIDKSVF